MELEEILEDHKRQVEIKIRQVLTEIVGGLVSAVTDAIDALNTAEAALQQALANNTSLADNAAAVTAIDGATTVMNAAAMLSTQVKYVNKAFWRNPASAFFTFAFPLMFLVIFTSLLGNGTIHIGSLSFRA